MRTDGFLQLVPQPAPYGPKLLPTETATHQLLDRWPKTLQRYADEIDFVATTLGSAGVGTLERWATALWVMRETPGADKTSWARRIHDVKPHVSIEDATQALDRVLAIETEAKARFPQLL